MAFTATKGLSLENAAKQLGTTRPKLIRDLKQRQVLMSNGLPYRQYIQQHLFVVETRSFRNIAGIERQYTVTLVTGTGLVFLTELLSEAA